jgi:beta-mannosidase
MARIVSITGRHEILLDAGWRLALTPPGACASSADAETLTDWLPARAPGTVAGALRDAGRLDLDAPPSLHEQDAWWRLDLTEAGPRTLRFDGLATIAEVWLEGRLALASRSMFVAERLAVDLKGGETLWLCFRALAPVLEQKLPRARWRPRMIPRQGLRGTRTTLLGQMPGWTPAIDAVGPWRPIRALGPAPVEVLSARLNATLTPDGIGLLSARVRLGASAVAPFLTCAGYGLPLTLDETGDFVGELVLPDVAPWWPHTHGEPALHAVALTVGETVIDLGRTGFRRIERTAGADGQGFGLTINGVPVFCRGACWTTADVVDLPGDREAYEPWLRLAREAGMNMLRMSGVGAYESPAFFELCDELGLLVWQDFLFANFDYPIGDPAFAALVTREVEGFLDAVQLSPSMAVLCGGSEVHQQATMMGLRPAATASALYDDLLPHAVQRWRPDAPYVVNSPSGGPLPFVTDVGVTHYFGVGAYRRPLEDARRAGVRFAAESLAFANVPQPLPGDADPLGAVPRDLGADWDFEDVRDHYLALLHGVDPAALRQDDPALYLDLSRLVTGQVMEAAFTEWRRAASPCQGSLVWTLQDLAPGAGWGVLDSFGQPKLAWYALKRAFRPLHLGLTDEGGNGLAIHLANEGAEPLALELELTCLREGATPVLSVRKPLDLPSRATLELSAFEVLGAFFDLTYAYRFGPRGHDAAIARLRRPGDETVLAETVYYPPGAVTPPPAALEATCLRGAEGWSLRLSAERIARGVILETPGFHPAENGFDLLPGAIKTIALRPLETGDDRSPRGLVRLPGGACLARFG